MRFNNFQCSFVEEIIFTSSEIHIGEMRSIGAEKRVNTCDGIYRSRRRKPGWRPRGLASSENKDKTLTAEDQEVYLDRIYNWRTIPLGDTWDHLWEIIVED